jgi:SH3-like domain-containing protein
VLSVIDECWLGVAMDRDRQTRERGRRRTRLGTLVALAAFAAAAQAQGTSPSPSFPGGSGLAVPRYVSLKSDRVNLRKGPGTDYPTAWVFRRAGLPLEVIKEFEGWRQVRDAEGVDGWVLQSFLSGRRTALVLPWDAKKSTPPPKVTLRYDDSERSRAVAMVEAGVIANLNTCDGRWCHVSIAKFKGYIEQPKLWGVYAGEIIK